jgi:hypothetical protein
VSAHHWEVIRKQIVTTMAKSVKETQLLTENPNHLNSICDGTPPLGCLAPEPPYGSFSFPPNRPCNPTRSLPLESLIASPLAPGVAHPPPLESLHITLVLCSVHGIGMHGAAGGTVVGHGTHHVGGYSTTPLLKKIKALREVGLKSSMWPSVS